MLQLNQCVPNLYHRLVQSEIKSLLHLMRRRNRHLFERGYLPYQHMEMGSFAGAIFQAEEAMQLTFLAMQSLLLRVPALYQGQIMRCTLDLQQRVQHRLVLPHL